MPRRIVSIRRRAEVRGLRSEWVEYLFFGWMIGPHLTFPEPSENEARAMWATHGGQLLQWWLNGTPADAFRRVHFGFGNCERSHPAGTRPWGWWRFDAPERRRLIAVETRTAERAPTAEDEVEAWRDGLGGFGLPRYGGPYRFETEADFLTRHGLLLPGEEVAP